MILGKGNTLSSAERLNTAIEEITVRLKTVPHVEVYEGLRDEEEQVEIGADNSFTPYIIVTFSGTSKLSRRNRSIAGARYSGENVSIVVRIVAHTPQIARQIRSYAHDLMMGFTPTGCSEISPALYYSTGAINTKGSPSRFSEIQSYEMAVS